MPLIRYKLKRMLFKYFGVIICVCWSAVLSAQVVLPPTEVVARPFEQHIGLRWTEAIGTQVTGYKIFRSIDGGATYSFLKQTGKQNFSFDWTGDEGAGVTRSYKIKTVAGPINESAYSSVVESTTFPMSDEQLMDMVQESTFRYFWEHSHPASGMARERYGSDEIVTTGGTGFGVMAIIAAAERGWITRDAALNRLIQIASFLQFADRFHGAFPHWMNGMTGNVVPFSQFDNGGDLVETAFLIQGLLAARTYFDQPDPLEAALRDAITGLWEEVEWDWYRRNNSNVLYWHWSPNYNWQMNFQLRGFNEVQIVYLLAVASPTHPIPPTLYQTGWAANSNYSNPSIHFGFPIYVGPFAGGPLFFAHYSYLGFDPRHKKDQYCNYFNRNRNHARIHQAYSIANPENHDGYSEECWGLTASDNPWGYQAHDPYPSNDNGTIAPTAALASMPYTPQESMAALRHFYRNLGENLWGDFGFYDAFNLDQNWFANSYLAIDQGPIVVMIENHRSGLFWKKFMQNIEIQPALDAIGFVSDSTSETNNLENLGFDCTLFPNPVAANTSIQVEISLLAPQSLSIQMYNAQGLLIQSKTIGRAFSPTIISTSIEVNTCPNGVYFLKIYDDRGRFILKRFVISKD